MPKRRLVECSFLIPLRRDSEISDGERHAPEAWQWLNDEIFAEFDGLTRAPGIYDGVWKSPKTGRPIRDRTRKFIVSIPLRRVSRLRAAMREACAVFEQQCIYLNVAGRVEFVEAGK